MDEIHKFGAIVVLISWAVGIVTAIILAIFAPYNWWFSYILGLVTALMNFGLMIKSNRKLQERALKDDPTLNPKRMTFSAFGLRVLVFIVVFAVVAYDEFKSPDPKLFIIPTIIGYLTLKFVVVIYGLIKKGKVMA